MSPKRWLKDPKNGREKEKKKWREERLFSTWTSLNERRDNENTNIRTFSKIERRREWEEEATREMWVKMIRFVGDERDRETSPLIIRFANSKIFQISHLRSPTQCGNSSSVLIKELLFLSFTAAIVDISSRSWHPQIVNIRADISREDGNFALSLTRSTTTTRTLN